MLNIKAEVASGADSMMMIAFRAKKALRRSMEKSKLYRKRVARRWAPMLQAVTEGGDPEPPGARGDPDSIGAAWAADAAPGGGPAPGGPEEAPRTMPPAPAQGRRVADPRRRRNFTAVPPPRGGLCPRPPSGDKPFPPLHAKVPCPPPAPIADLAAFVPTPPRSSAASQALALGTLRPVRCA